MHRAAALIVLLALTVASARQLACVWECGEPAGSVHEAASCHETTTTGPTLAAGEAHCPLAPDAAVLTGAASEPHRQRLSLALDRLGAAPDVSPSLRMRDHRSAWSFGQVHGHRSRTLSVLRI